MIVCRIAGAGQFTLDPEENALAMRFSDLVGHLLRPQKYAFVRWYLRCVIPVRPCDTTIPVLLEIHMRRFNHPFYQCPDRPGVNEDARCVYERWRVTRLRG
jgi:hypothetical protein